jgi:hypothetical protein
MIMPEKIDFYNIPVFIISYNRLGYLSNLIEWLEKAGYKNIHIVDNNSTYPPLLDYLSRSRHQVHRLDKNYGHLVVWECGLFDPILKSVNYVVSDCDILPVEECPANAVEYFHGILSKYQNFTKAGFSIKIDDLPESYLLKEKVTDWEKQFWETRIEENLFEAAIDTTFALYRPGIYPTDDRWWRSIRAGFPYMSRHLPWYQDSSNLTDEEKFYQRNLKDLSTHWSITDPVALKEQNVKLQWEIYRLQDEIKWMKREFWFVKKDLKYYLKLPFSRILKKHE